MVPTKATSDIVNATFKYVFCSANTDKRKHLDTLHEQTGEVTLATGPTGTMFVLQKRKATDNSHF